MTSNLNLYGAGVDIGASSVKCGLVSDQGVIIERVQAMIDDRSPQGVVDLIIQCLEELRQRHHFDDDDIQLLGIGCPGEIQNGIVIGSANFSTWSHVPLQQMVTTTTGLPNVSLCNDADAAVAAEHWVGAAAAGAVQHFVMITLGSGVGTGIVNDGVIVQGHHGVIEGGHMIVERNGRLCGCSQRGCLEMYASANAVVAQATERRKGTDSLLCQETTLDARKVFECVESGDSVAIQVVDEAAEYLGLACVNFTRLLDPKLIILSGGMAEAGEAWIRRVRAAFDQYAWTKLSNSVEIVKAISGYDSGIIGAVGFPKITKGV